jgi:hypothetical protein
VTPRRRRCTEQASGRAGPRPVAAAATARVSKVELVSPGRVQVTYTILASGQPVLGNQAGVAIYSGGSWKVGKASYCRLLVLENGGSSSSLPAACRGGG